MYCNYKAVCVKCTGDHQTNTCKLVKTEESKAKCCNRNGEHPANFGKCPKLEAYLESKKGNQPRTFQSNYIRPEASYVNATKNQTDDLNELTKEMRELNESSNLKQMLLIMKEANSRIKQASTILDKLLILQEIIENRFIITPQMLTLRKSSFVTHRVSEVNTKK